MTSRTKLKRKEIDDVLGGEEMWKHADSTQGESPQATFTQSTFNTGGKTASCDKCNHNKAYFYQLQIRSADEPMTTCTFLPIPIIRLTNLLISYYSLSVWPFRMLIGTLLTLGTDVLLVHTVGARTERWSYVMTRVI